MATHYPDQPQLNRVFDRYAISFRNPTRVANNLEKAIRRNISIVGITTQAQLVERVRNSNAGELWDIIQDISEMTHHRHRVDAENILDEVVFRIRDKDPPRELMPHPMDVPYTGHDRVVPLYTAEENRDRMRPHFERMAAELAWKTGDVLPKAWWTPGTAGPRLKKFSEDNDDLAGLFVQNAGVSNAAVLAMRNILAADPPANMWVPPLRRDDADEAVLDLPEECELITAATPQSAGIQAALARQMYQVEVWDYRLGERKDTRSLGPKHYIYQLVSLVRDIARLPGVARAYAIIFRADPLRYWTDSDDELADEAGPTEEEVQCIISFLSMTFPEVRIATDVPDSVVAWTMSQEHLVKLHRVWFDRIEEGYASGKNVSHYLYIIYRALFHELGHYLRICIWRGKALIPDAILSTPRKLRGYVNSRFETDDPHHPYHLFDSNPFHGEMGQIIEWLIFGNMINAGEAYIEMVCWGSSLSMGANCIRIDAHAAALLLAARPPIRMGGVALRAWVTAVQNQRVAAARAALQASARAALRGPAQAPQPPPAPQPPQPPPVPQPLQPAQTVRAARQAAAQAQVVAAQVAREERLVWQAEARAARAAARAARAEQEAQAPVPQVRLVLAHVAVPGPQPPVVPLQPPMPPVVPLQPPVPPQPPVVPPQPPLVDPQARAASADEDEDNMDIDSASSVRTGPTSPGSNEIADSDRMDSDADEMGEDDVFTDDDDDPMDLDAQGSGTPSLGGAHRPDVDRAYSGHAMRTRTYRRAVQRVRAENHRRHEGMTPLVAVRETYRPPDVRALGNPGVARPLLGKGCALYLAAASGAIWMGVVGDLRAVEEAVTSWYAVGVGVLLALVMAVLLVRGFSKCRG